MTEKNILGQLACMAKNILGRYKKSSNRKIYSNAKSADLSMGLSQREKAIYGEDKIKQQKLYEKWAVKTTWHLKDQAIPLLLSIDPEKYSDSSYDKAAEHKYQDLWEHAQQCVEQDLLFVINRESPVEEWEAKPIDVYKWAAISRVDLPEQLSTLMEFVMMTLVHTENDALNSQDGKDQTDVSYNSSKEHILGAALAMLSSYPDQCVNKKGRMRAENIISLINENEIKLFGEKTPDLSSTAAIDLINKWIRTSY